MYGGDDRRRNMLRNAGSMSMSSSTTKFGMNKDSSLPQLNRQGSTPALGGNRAKLGLGSTGLPALEPPSPSAFQPSAKFAGARPGYAFKLGRNGLGYYADKMQLGKLEAPPAQQRAADESQHEPFVPAPRFAGAQPGYVFKLGKAGLGYYVDTYDPRKIGERMRR
eukprot:CAMPEP_0203863546 /NCGR_PEP_ID=MMETSP0359-20131031/14232_1 /ASSEMBLY_ACC=CAM_ASM_000338 /TAXON_ID=268821 /ORGANISM="Scrippsiella Hangoei, Strain SHTV-5" /LENGTH=164 /DNA_ID=CAMNT_0050781113 /DNA_START=67 /DNA_END=561 /DNA_ORIENTATION=+